MTTRSNGFRANFARISLSDTGQNLCRVCEDLRFISRPASFVLGAFVLHSSWVPELMTTGSPDLIMSLPRQQRIYARPRISTASLFISVLTLASCPVLNNVLTFHVPILRMPILIGLTLA